jgi:hypothetical protein
MRSRRRLRWEGQRKASVDNYLISSTALSAEELMMNPLPVRSRCHRRSSFSSRSSLWVTAAALVVVCGLAWAPAAQGASLSCWQVTGWTNLYDYTDIPGYVRASRQYASCDTIPDGWGWVQVTDVSPANGVAYHLRLPLNGPYMTGWRFNGELFVTTQNITSNPPATAPVFDAYTQFYSSPTWLNPYPPVQGSYRSGSKVRLRHAGSGKCIYANGPNGGSVKNWGCWNDPAMTFVLEAASGLTYRLRSQSSGQCLYAQTLVGAPARSWQCWSDSNLRFAIENFGDGKRLRHIDTGQCLYGSSSDGGEVRATTCSSSPSQKYWLDVIQY